MECRSQQKLGKNFPGSLQVFIAVYNQRVGINILANVLPQLKDFVLASSHEKIVGNLIGRFS